MDITQATTEELLAEISKREKEKLESDHFLCMGIIDADGAESLMPVKTKEEFASLHSSLSLRARFNSQRNPLLYVVNITQPLFDEFDSRLKKGEYVEVGEHLKKLTTFKLFGY